MIESVKIKVGDQTLELSLEEARKLKKDLDTLFAKPVVIPSYPDRWREPGRIVPRPYYPLESSGDSLPPPSYSVTCGQFSEAKQ